MRKDRKRTIVITGVSSGIGKSLVEQLVKDDLNQVFGIGRTNLSLNVPNYTFLSLDLADSKAIAPTISTIIGKTGRIDVLVNNAGVGYVGTIEDLKESDIRKQFEINLFAPVLLIKSVLKHMRNQNRGHIINVGSIATVVSTPTLGYYASTKSAMDKIMDVLRYEIKEYNIKISTISPGAVKTSFGKNMLKNIDLGESSYTSVYECWERRFRNYFKSHQRPEEIASAIIRIIECDAEVRNHFPFIRERILSIGKKILPQSIYDKLFLDIYYKE